MKRFVTFLTLALIPALSQAATFKVQGFGSFTAKAPNPTTEVAKARAEQAALDKCMAYYHGQPQGGTQKTNCEEHVSDSDGVKVWITATCVSEVMCDN